MGMSCHSGILTDKSGNESKVALMIKICKSELPFKTLFWAGEMTESVKRVHYKYEYLSLESRTHIKSQACTCNPSTEEAERRILGAHW